MNDFNDPPFDDDDDFDSDIDDDRPSDVDDDPGELTPLQPAASEPLPF